MVILGLDPSQKTGWSLYDPDANLSAMRCGTLKAHGNIFESKAADLAVQLVALLKRERSPAGKILLPSFAAIEMPPRQKFGMAKKRPKFLGEEIEDESEGEGGTGLGSVISTNQMAAALAAVLGAYGIPFVVMKDSVWRKAAYGFGTRPGWRREDWKKHARQLCAQHRIIATNDDMAEACWIAFAGKGHQWFKDMQRKAAA